MVSSPADADYFLLSARVNSFNPPRKASSKSQARSGKAAASQKLATRAWPHPKSFNPNPDSLAAAGFFFTAPLDENAGPDQAECFMCARSLAGWEKDDDPHHEHARREAECPWAVAVCSIQQDRASPGQTNWAFRSEDRLPTNRALEKARLGTFEKRWPHDGVKGHLVSSKKMAKAGFVFTPTQVSADMVTCFYCNMALDGWEPKDNPMTEHRRRSPDCPVFTAQVENLLNDEPPLPSKATSKSRSKKASSVTPQSVESMQIGAPSAPTRVKRSTRATTNKRQPAIEEESEVDPGQQAPQVASLSKSTRTRAGKSKPKPEVEELVVEEEEDVEEILAPAPKQTSRAAPSRGAAKVQARSVSANHKKQAASESEQPSESQASVSLAKSTRKKATRAPVPAIPVEDEPSQSQTTRRTAVRTKKGPTKADSEEEIIAIVSPPRPHTKKPTAKKAKSTKVSVVAEEEGDGVTSQEPISSPEAEPDQSTPKPLVEVKTKAKSAKTASKKPVATKSKKVSKADEEVAAADDELSAAPSADEMEPEPPHVEPERNAGVTTDVKKPLSQSAMVLDEDEVPNRHIPGLRSPKPTLTKNAQTLDGSWDVVAKPKTPPAEATPRANTKRQSNTTAKGPALSAIVPHGLDAFTVAERAMTLEQYILHRMEIECDQIKMDGQREIDAFSEESRRVRKLIEDA